MYRNSNKRRRSLPDKLSDSQGIPQLTPKLDEYYAQFLSCKENWDQVVTDLYEVDFGRGLETLKSILKKEKFPQLSLSTPPRPPTESGENVVLLQSQPISSPSSSSLWQESTGKQTVASSLKRSADKARLSTVPRFYWPEGKPVSNGFIQECISKAENKLKQHDNCVFYNKFGELLVESGIPLYWKKPFWLALCLSPEASCTPKTFIPCLRYLLCECPDDASRFSRIVSSAVKSFTHTLVNNINGHKNVAINNVSRHHNNNQGISSSADSKQDELSMSDFIPMIQDIIDTHPGKARIFTRCSRVSEHFYVIYCKFWELDKDHDLLIDKQDLATHADHALSSRMIDRIFSGTVLRGWDVTTSVRVSQDKMTYSDFVWFLLSEEDKKTPTAIEYWFRCLDMDGDGVISPYELQYFYSEQESRIESLGIEPLHFSNVYCQIVDMLHCSPTGFLLRDLKRNPHLAANVFNTVFNLDKYLEHEQRDPFAASATLNNTENEGESDWNKYASSEYELLIAEESPAENMNESGFEDSITP